MRIFRKFQRALALPLAVVMVLVSLPMGVATAGLVTTDSVIAGDTAHAAASADRARLQRFLDREDVRDQMRMLGVDPAEAAKRVAALSDAEVRDAVGRIDALPAGQGALGTVLGIALVIFVILLVTDILGLTDVFPFVRR